MINVGDLSHKICNKSATNLQNTGKTIILNLTGVTSLSEMVRIVPQEADVYPTYCTGWIYITNPGTAAASDSTIFNVSFHLL